MPALWAALLLGSHITLAPVTLVADRIPELDVKPSCRAATTAAVMPNRNEDSCLRDEQTARDKLQEEWGTFSAAERDRCTSLSHRGGSPSYVELLTCLELAKSASELPDDGLGKIGR